MLNFWSKLPKPFTVLAPLDGVTDVVFRQMIVKIGKPDVLFTEFTSTDGLQSNGRQRVMQNLLFEPNEQPIVAQIWGTKPINFTQTAKDIKKMGFAGIDINMGCPAHDITKNGACSGLINNPKLAGEIIQATKDGAGGLPVSVKTRVGIREQNLDWIEFLLNQNLAVLTVHLRTVAELSRVPAHWELMPKIIEMRDQIAPQTLIIGNGDLASMEEIKQKYAQFNCEGFMVGRGIFANPWFFNQDGQEITVKQRFETFLAQIELFEQTWGNTKNPENLKKFCKAYINNFPEATRYREQIMDAKTLTQLREIVVNFLNEFNPKLKPEISQLPIPLKAAKPVDSQY